jgi:hypothetical protein
MNIIFFTFICQLSIAYVFSIKRIIWDEKVDYSQTENLNKIKIFNKWLDSYIRSRTMINLKNLVKLEYKDNKISIFLKKEIEVAIIIFII